MWAPSSHFYWQHHTLLAKKCLLAYLTWYSPNSNAFIIWPRQQMSPRPHPLPLDTPRPSVKQVFACIPHSTRSKAPKVWSILSSDPETARIANCFLLWLREPLLCLVYEIQINGRIWWEGACEGLGRNLKKIGDGIVGKDHWNDFLEL